MGNWDLTDKQRKDIKPLVEKYLNNIEELDSLEDFNENKEKLDLTFKEISPYQLKELLEELGYEESDFDKNGWECDFWIYMLNHNKENTYKICISGCGMTFELKLGIIVE